MRNTVAITMSKQFVKIVKERIDRQTDRQTARKWAFAILQKLQIDSRDHHGAGSIDRSARKPAVSSIAEYSRSNCQVIILE